MASIRISPEGGEPSGAPKIASNMKQANEEPENIYLPGPDANTEGALKLRDADTGSRT